MKGKRQSSIRMGLVFGLGIAFCLMSCGKGGSYSENQPLSSDSASDQNSGTTGDGGNVLFQALTKSVCDQQPDQFVEVAAEFAGDSGHTMSIPVTGVLFDLNAVTTVPQVNFSIAGIPGQVVTGAFTYDVGSDLFGHVGPGWAHWESDISFNIDPGVNSVVLKIDLSNFSASQIGGNGSVIMAFVGFRYDSSFQSVPGGKSIFQFPVNFSNCQ